MFGRTRLSVPATTWAYVVILSVAVLGAVMREINLLIILAGMMCGPLLISWQMILTNLRQLHVRRCLPDGVFAGTEFDVQFEVRNGRKRVDSWALVFEDRIRNLTSLSSEAAAATNGQCFLAHLPAGQERRIGYTARLDARGRYRFGPLRVSSRVPVGLIQGRATAKMFDEILVYPRLGYLQRSWRQAVDFDLQGQRSARRRQGSNDGQFFALRYWRSGDSRRWIHWRSSAKRGELVVRQFAQQHHRGLVMLLDLTQVPDSLSAEETAAHVERAVSFVATAVTEHCRRTAGQLVLRVAGKVAGEVRGLAGPAVLHDALELLAEAGVGQPSDPMHPLGPAADTRSDDHLVIVSCGPFDLDRWCGDPGRDESRERMRLSQAILVDVCQQDFDRWFSWTEEDTGQTVTAGGVAG